MQRRTLLKTLLLGPLATLVRPEKTRAQPPTGTVYTDSAGRDTASLAALFDGDKVNGGIVYQP